MTQAGHHVEVLTRHFTGKENGDEYNDDNSTPFSISTEEGVSVYRTPFKNTWFKYHSYSILVKTGLWKLIYFIQLAAGRLTQESYNYWFQKYIGKVTDNKIDLVMVECGPANLVRLTSSICRRKKIPYCIDFRDVYYHDMLFNGRLPWNKRIKIRIEEYYMKSSIAAAKAIIGESMQKLKALKVPLAKSHVIHNGYDELLWSDRNRIVNEAKTFTIVVAGRLYTHPFLWVLLNAFSSFLAYKLPAVLIRFIAPGDKKLIRYIYDTLGYENIEVIPERVDAEDAIQMMNTAQVLAYHGWQGYSGVYSTKVYDYLRSGKRILICPSDHDVLDELLRTQEGCYLENDPAAAAKILLSIYTEWKSNKLIDIDRGSSIAPYSRQNQSKKILKIVEDAF